MGNLLEANKPILVLGSSSGLDGPVPSHAESSIVAVSERGTLDSGDKNIILVISLTEKFKHFWVFIVADCFKDHVVSFL